MAFQLQTHNIYSIWSFDRAEEVYEQARGPKLAAWYGNAKTLRKNRLDEKVTIRKLTGDKDVTGYACRYHSSDCVIYWSDGRIEIDFTGWSTPSTAAFIERVSGFRTYKNQYILVNGKYYYIAVTVKRIEDGEYEILQSRDSPLSYRLNREAARKVHKFLGPWKKWCSALEAIGAWDNLPLPPQKPGRFITLREYDIDQPLLIDQYPEVVKRTKWGQLRSEATIARATMELMELHAVESYPTPIGELPRKCKYA